MTYIIVFISCVRITQFIIYCVSFQNNVYTKIISNRTLSYMITMPTRITDEQLVLYYIVISFFIT